ncbi:MAG: glutamine--fructose-6-phosphate aminotransferase [isomerizing] [Candidatus Binatia bacterium]|nr:MAG: glutamine--fructose-6-phosphate aminotransferase [isomerizing] [Candidatus Binatia bacterium]
MCGIVGYVGKQDALPILIAGLYRLEYRGYDSAGVALVARGGLKVHKRAGKIRQLEASLPKRLKGHIGIAHTRWATHGAPSDANSHPHLDCKQKIAVVHNGIIENAAELRAQLERQGHVFRSETDTEVLAHLIESANGRDLTEAVRLALGAVRGTYGIAVLDERFPDRLVVARNGSPVVIGLGDREMFVASDVAALVRHTQHVVFLDDREIATVEAGGFRTSTLDDEPREKSPARVQWGYEAYDRGSYPHYMLKEIMEQPEACERTLKGRLDHQFGTARFGGIHLSARDLLEIRRVKILGCGSAYYAGMAGAHMIETLTRIPADAEPASEFRYRNPVIEKEALYIAVSQSGETADTLAAVREIRRKGGHVMGIVNVVGSSIARECGGGIYIHAGPEIAVASTKAFTCTLVAFALFALHLGRIRDLSPGEGKRLIDALQRLPGQIAEVLRGAERIRRTALKYARAANAFFIGRAQGYPVALEGAQKLKEISYIHAEAYPASELKHGPLALICPETPTFVVLPHDDLYEKTLSSLQEVRARKGPVVAVTNPGDERLASLVDDVLVVPPTEPVLSPILLTIPLQLVAYYVAVELGRDVDQPRNLAKSVTVE